MTLEVQVLEKQGEVESIEWQWATPSACPNS